MLFGVSGIAILALPLVTEAGFALSLAIAPALAAMFASACLAGAYLVAEAKRSVKDPETGLPNLRALAKAATERSGATNLVVARIERFAAIASGSPRSFTGRTSSGSCR